MPEEAGLYYSVYEGGNSAQAPVVLIHGAGGSHLSWPVEMRRLSGQRVISIDLPGHGKSGGVAQQFIPGYADQIHDLLARLGLPESVLVGHSLGGAVALTIALKYPRQVAGLGLIATGAYLGVDNGLLQELSNPVTASCGLRKLEELSFSPSSSPALVNQVMRGLKDLRPSLLLADWLACSNFDLRELVGQIHAPAWVACGTDDRITPLAYAHFLANSLLAAELQVFPQAGHMLVQEQSRAVADGLRQFLTTRQPAIESYCWDLQRQYARVGSIRKNP
jgi:pimeloyl-ACP methyl ester carboxylesterase